MQTDGQAIISNQALTEQFPGQWMGACDSGGNKPEAAVTESFQETSAASVRTTMPTQPVSSRWISRREGTGQASTTPTQSVYLTLILTA